MLHQSFIQDFLAWGGETPFYQTQCTLVSGPLLLSSAGHMDMT